MTTRKKPRIDTWQHLAHNYAMRDKSLKETVAELIAEFGQPTPYELGKLRSSYYRGRITSAAEDLMSMARYLNREERIALAADLEALRNKYDALFPTESEDTP